MIGAAEYKEAAEEHLSAAYECHRSGNHLTCYYLCGLAVECILRAYRWRIDATWDGRHVPHRLYRSSEFDKGVGELALETLEERFGVIALRWANDHRYASAAKLLRHLNGLGVNTNVRGDKLERNSRQMYDAASFIVDLGIRRWRP
ncbi:hypothetical protein BH11ARM2_BH11ARM2_21910 [soil metagenome]